MKYCSKCGKLIKDNDSFCRNCGSITDLSLSDSKANNRPIQSVKNTGKPYTRKIFGIGICVFIVVTVFIVGTVLWNNIKPKSVNGFSGGTYVGLGGISFISVSFECYDEKSYNGFEGAYKEYWNMKPSGPEILLSSSGEWKTEEGLIVEYHNSIEQLNKYVVYKDYLIIDNSIMKSDNLVPDGDDSFNLTCTDNSGNQYIFNENGHVKYIDVDSTNNWEGTYKREGELIVSQKTDADVSTNIFIVYNGSIAKGVFIKARAE